MADLRALKPLDEAVASHGVKLLEHIASYVSGDEGLHHEAVQSIVDAGSMLRASLSASCAIVIASLRLCWRAFCLEFAA